MRIGLLIYGSLDTVSGGYLYDRKLVEHLHSQGDSVEIISLPWRNYARHLGDNLSPTLLNDLARLSLDVLLQDELNHPSLFWLNRRLRKIVRYPFISIVHHLRSSEARPAWQKSLYAWVERHYLSGVGGFIYNSHTTRQAVECLLAENQLSRTPAVPIPSVVASPAGDRLDPQIQEDEIARRAWQAGPLRMIFVGNVIPRKGLHTVLAALQLRPEISCRLEVVGSLQGNSAYGWKMLHQIEGAGLNEKVRFSGPLPDGELAGHLKNSHVLVGPSTYEGFGIVYLEGMGFGLPAIGTTAGGAAEVISSGKDGFLIQPGDAPALAGCIKELAQNRRHLLEMSLAARQRYEAHPTWRDTGVKIRTFLSSLLA